MQFDVDDEGASVREVPFPSETAVVSGPGSRPDGGIWSMQTKTVIWIELTSPVGESHQEALRKDGQVQQASD